MTRSGEAPPAPPCYPVCSGKGGRNCSGRAEHEAEAVASLRIDLGDPEAPGEAGRFFLFDEVEKTYVCAVSHCPWCGSKLVEAK